MKTYSHPHYRQSHTWQRFARILSGVRDYAYQRKEDALKWSLEKGASGFAIPTELELEATDARGLGLLTSRIERGYAFPEIALRTRYNEDRDRLEVEVTLHRRTKQKVQAVRVGIVPEKDARWIRPLMKSHLGLQAFVVSAEQTGGTKMHTGHSVTVAIRRPDEAAQEWIDLYDDRKQKAKGGAQQTRRSGVPAYLDGPSTGAATGGTDYNKKIAETRAEISRLNVKASKLEAKKQSCAHIGRQIAGLKGKVKHYEKKAAQSECRMVERPSEEEILRENISARETCMTDLGNEDYWNARHQM